MTGKITAWAQIALSFAFIGGYFVVLGMFLLGYVRVPVEFKDALIALIGVITGSVGTIVGFWFLRQRPNGSVAGG